LPLDVARKEGNAEVVEILCKTAEALNGHAGKGCPTRRCFKLNKQKISVANGFAKIIPYTSLSRQNLWER
jgi:hypothetical protein